MVVRHHCHLIVVGSVEMAFTEGTTQVDPTTYALAIVPLIHKLRNNSPQVKQISFQTIAGSCEYLRQW